MPRILEFRHVGPFDGCFHRWEYLLFEGSLDNSRVYPIVFTEGHLTAWQVFRLAVREELQVPSYDSYKELFKDFAWYEWGQEIFQEIPHGYVPAFWKFAQERGLDFIWVCDECGEPQTDEPMRMAGYHSNGGVGIEVEGWLCEDCAYEQKARYYERLENEAREQIRGNENDC